MNNTEERKIKNERQLRKCLDELGYNYTWYHARLDLAKGKKQIREIKNEFDLHRFKTPIRGVTKCIIYTRNTDKTRNPVAIGLAYCVMNDHYNKSKGRVASLGRAYSTLMKKSTNGLVIPGALA